MKNTSVEVLSVQRLSVVSAILLFTGAMSCSASAQETLQLHPRNPHYFIWHDQPTVLITSGEHYGAVLNLDFDYVRYLDTLAADELNLTRTFSGGTYYEPQGSFNIAHNTLAPGLGRYMGPWARSHTPGYAGGGNKFDLTGWDEAYFERLRDFVRQANQRGIVVELNLFCPFYEESQWKLSPFNSINNVNDLGPVARTNVYTLDKSGSLLAFEDKLVRRIVEELREFGNAYYEICNEPYFGGVTLEWQHHIAEVITGAQKSHPYKKLISQNIANQSAKVPHPDPAVSILNFHYASPPVTVAMNYGLDRVIGDNETGFRGTNNAPYLAEAWEFILAGGGLFNNLDYSFTAGHEDGTFVYPASQPGGGNPLFRKQLRVLRDFINSFEFVNLRPDSTCIKARAPADLTAYALTTPGKAYAIYLRRSKALTEEPQPASLTLELPPGHYQAEWIDPESGMIQRKESFEEPTGTRDLTAPPFRTAVALRLQTH
jgi:hypothetical protein